MQNEARKNAKSDLHDSNQGADDRDHNDGPDRDLEVMLRSDEIHEYKRDQHGLQHRDEIDDESARAIYGRIRKIRKIEQQQQNAEEHNARQDDLKRWVPQRLGKQENKAR